jgi:hypothetical protein
MNDLRRGIGMAVGALALCLAASAQAQDNLDRGKSGAQLFASDCAICHKSPQGLNKSNRLFGLDSFLREHYTVSRESAAAIAAYVKAMDTGPEPARSRAPRREAKPKSGEKAGEKTGGKKPDAAKTGEPESKPSEVKPAETGTAAPKASEPKPAEAAKPN